MVLDFYWSSRHPVPSLWTVFTLFQTLVWSRSLTNCNPCFSRRDLAPAVYRSEEHSSSHAKDYNTGKKRPGSAIILPDMTRSRPSFLLYFTNNLSMYRKYHRAQSSYSALTSYHGIFQSITIRYRCPIERQEVTLHTNRSTCPESGIAPRVFGLSKSQFCGMAPDPELPDKHSAPEVVQFDLVVRWIKSCAEECRGVRHAENYEFKHDVQRPTFQIKSCQTLEQFGLMASRLNVLN